MALRMLFIIALIIIYQSVLLVNTVKYVHQDNLQRESSKVTIEIATNTENFSNVYHFVSACIAFWDLKNPKIFLSEGKK